MKNKLLLWSITVALAGFLFGFDTVVISGADKSLTELWSSYKLFDSSSAFHGVVVMSSALWGTVLGAIVGAKPTDIYGRKNTLIIVGLLFLISATGSALVSNPYLFAFFRFLGGIGVGTSTIAAPAFITEIAPASRRGRLVALYQFNIVFGILIAFASNYLINQFVDAQQWRWMLGVEAVPALFYILMVIKVPKSPRWLMLKGKRKEAEEVLLAFNPPHEVEKQISIIQTDIYQSNSKTKLETILSFKYRKQLFLVIALAIFNQFSGINAFLYYSPRIFELAGFNEGSALISSIGVGAVNLVFTLIGLNLIDRSGRRNLMYFGSIGYIVSLGLVSYSFATDWLGIHVAYFFFLFIASHAIGQGAVIWVFISEIFPNKLRAQGQSIGSSTHWVLAALIPAFIPFLFENIGPSKVFMFFTLMMIIQLIWVYQFMPETKGIALEALTEKLSKPPKN